MADSLETGKTENQTPIDPLRLAVRIRAGCLRKGWSFGQLAERAGVSRTTLYHLERGRISRPRLATLGRIAAALEFDPRQLAGLSGPVRPNWTEETGREDERRRFDRSTNTAVSDACRESPELFADWVPSEWDELYSTFGTGGPLTSEGVAETARRINHKRETVRQLQIVLETHLAEVAAGMVETLFRMVTPSGAVSPAQEQPGATQDE